MAGKKVKPWPATWLDRCLVRSPIHFCLVTNEETYKAQMERLGVPKPKFPFVSKSNAAEVHPLTDKEGDECCVVAINYDVVKKYSKASVHAVLAHEATHIWQLCRRSIGEAAPSDEFEAYAIQNITRNLCEEYERQTKKPRR